MLSSIIKSIKMGTGAVVLGATIILGLESCSREETPQRLVNLDGHVVNEYWVYKKGQASSQFINTYVIIMDTKYGRKCIGVLNDGSDNERKASESLDNLINRGDSIEISGLRENWLDSSYYGCTINADMIRKK